VYGAQNFNTVETLHLLGTSLAMTGRYAEAASLFQETLQAQKNSPDPALLWRTWYSFACVANAADRKGDAILYLHKAVSRGYRDATGLMNDEDLKSLHHDPRFQEIIATLKRSSGPIQAP
jgi:hypothetical protein